MPFTRLKKGVYRGPSGRTFNLAQVRRYYARGGTFDRGALAEPVPQVSCPCGSSHEQFTCDTGRAITTRRDPTGTSRLRKRFAADLDRRWLAVRRATLDIVGKQNTFGFGMPTAVSVGQGGTVRSASAWLDATLTQAVIGDGTWVMHYILDAYVMGVLRAEKKSGREAVLDTQRSDLVAAATVSELQGVADAVRQHGNRVIGMALISANGPADAANGISRAIADIGVIRGHSVVSFMIVRAYTEGTLDALQALGHKRVGVVPERIPRALARIVAPASDHDQTLMQQDARRKSRGVSAYKQSKIEKAEQKLGALEMVNVLTAEDDEVCPVCQQIAEDGPYDIDHARTLIPAHPHCRCAFDPF